MEPASGVGLRALSAKFNGDFAYPTVKDRLPIILTKVLDLFCRYRSDLQAEYGEPAVEESKEIAGRLSKLKNELQTDKVLLPVQDSWRDAAAWNEKLEVEKAKTSDPEEPSWFKSPWLYVECYMYRRIHEAIQLSPVLRSVDPFHLEKVGSFVNSIEPMDTLATFLINSKKSIDKYDLESTKNLFDMFFQVALWGNKCDLSISGGKDNAQTQCPIKQLGLFVEHLLVDEKDQVWQLLQAKQSSDQGCVQLDVVLDNAGFELFTDLILVDFLIAVKLVDRVVFHAKAFGWFVSDVTPCDLQWTLQQLSTNERNSLSALGEQWSKYIVEGKWNVKTHDFWTLPYAFCDMKEQSPDLFKELQTSTLMLLKGDLNYRKLTQDLKWDPETPFEVALGGFHPAPLCTLRTLKADVVVGLKPKQAEETQAKHKNWMITGDYAVIQFCNRQEP